MYFLIRAISISDTISLTKSTPLLLFLMIRVWFDFIFNGRLD